MAVRELTPAEAGVVIGTITIVQESRIRLSDAEGRGWLFVVRPRVASAERLEGWRDAGTSVAVRYRGVPDAGAVADAIAPTAEPGEP